MRIVTVALAREVITSADSNELSLIGLVTGIIGPPPPPRPEGLPPDAVQIIAFPCTILVVWQIGDTERGVEVPNAELTFEKDGQVLLRSPLTINTEQGFHRNKVKFVGLPVTDYGQYEFVVRFRDNAGSEHTWAYPITFSGPKG